MTLGAWSSASLRARATAQPRGRLLIVTGEPGSGKSTRCRQVVRTAREAGLVVRGVVGVDKPVAGGVERWLEDLRNGERVLLGRMGTPEAIAAGAPRWTLEDAALDRCDAILRAACPADLLVIDEVGPVELIQRRGALAGVRRALSGQYVVAVVVVRPWLVPRFLELFPDPPAEVVDVLGTDVLARLVAVVTAREPS